MPVNDGLGLEYPLALPTTLHGLLLESFHWPLLPVRHRPSIDERCCNTCEYTACNTMERAREAVDKDPCSDAELDDSARTIDTGNNSSPHNDERTVDSTS